MTKHIDLDALRGELLETLQGIADADWRKWEELASPEEFVRWAKSRANHMIARIRELEGDTGKSAGAWISVGELAKFLSDIDSPAERPDALAKLICDWLPSRAGERKSDGVVESKANSLGGFVGGFIGLHGRKPTEQEIWNAAVQSGMRRVKAARSATFMPPKEGWQYEYSPSTKYVQASHPKGGKQSICEVTIPFDSDAIGYAIAAALAGRAAPEGGKEGGE